MIEQSGKQHRLATQRRGQRIARQYFCLQESKRRDEIDVPVDRFNVRLSHGIPQWVGEGGGGMARGEALERNRASRSAIFWRNAGTAARPARSPSRIARCLLSKSVELSRVMSGLTTTSASRRSWLAMALPMILNVWSNTSTVSSTFPKAGLAEMSEAITRSAPMRRAVRTGS